MCLCKIYEYARPNAHTNKTYHSYSVSILVELVQHQFWVSNIFGDRDSWKFASDDHFDEETHRAENEQRIYTPAGWGACVLSDIKVAGKNNNKILTPRTEKIRK